MDSNNKTTSSAADNETKNDSSSPQNLPNSVESPNDLKQQAPKNGTAKILKSKKLIGIIIVVVLLVVSLLFLMTAPIKQVKDVRENFLVTIGIKSQSEVDQEKNNQTNSNTAEDVFTEEDQKRVEEEEKNKVKEVENGPTMPKTQASGTNKPQ